VSKTDDGTERPVVEVVIRTRHPEHYHLVNLRDWTIWKIVDGRWQEVGESVEAVRDAPPRKRRRTTTTKRRDG
jgi:hypothetical protein